MSIISTTRDAISQMLLNPALPETNERGAGADTHIASILKLVATKDDARKFIAKVLHDCGCPDHLCSYAAFAVVTFGVPIAVRAGESTAVAILRGIDTTRWGRAFLNRLHSVASAVHHDAKLQQELFAALQSPGEKISLSLDRFTDRQTLLGGVIAMRQQLGFSAAIELLSRIERSLVMQGDQRGPFRRFWPSNTAATSEPSLVYFRQQDHFVGREGVFTDLFTGNGLLAPPSDAMPHFRWQIIHGRGGSGKSRLFYEILNHERTISQWPVAGFVLPPLVRRETIQRWLPEVSTLVVVDYASEQGHRLRDFLDALADHAEASRIHIRCALLDRTAHGDWVDRLTTVRGDNPLLPTRRIDPFELPVLGSDELVAIVRGRLGKVEIDDASLIAALKELDTDTRPIFAAMLGQALAEKGDLKLLQDANGRLRRSDLIDNYIGLQRGVWMHDAKRPLVLRYENLLTLTTLTRGLTLAEFGRARGALARDGAPSLPGLPDAPTDPIDFDRVARMADMPGTDETGELPPVQPDLIGERYVLQRLLDPQDSAAPIFRDLAWTIDPIEVGHTVALCFEDYPLDVLACDWLAPALPTTDKSIVGWLRASQILGARLLADVRLGIEKNDDAMVDTAAERAGLLAAKIRCVLQSHFGAGRPPTGEALAHAIPVLQELITAAAAASNPVLLGDAFEAVKAIRMPADVRGAATHRFLAAIAIAISPSAVASSRIVDTSSVSLRRPVPAWLLQAALLILELIELTDDVGLVEIANLALAHALNAYGTAKQDKAVVDALMPFIPHALRLMRLPGKTLQWNAAFVRIGSALSYALGSNPEAQRPLARLVVIARKFAANKQVDNSTADFVVTHLSNFAITLVRPVHSGLPAGAEKDAIRRLLIHLSRDLLEIGMERSTRRTAQYALQAVQTLWVNFAGDENVPWQELTDGCRKAIGQSAALFENANPEARARLPDLITTAIVTAIALAHESAWQSSDAATPADALLAATTLDWWEAVKKSMPDAIPGDDSDMWIYSTAIQVQFHPTLPDDDPRRLLGPAILGSPRGPNARETACIGLNSLLPQVRVADLDRIIAVHADLARDLGSADISAVHRVALITSTAALAVTEAVDHRYSAAIERLAALAAHPICEAVPTTQDLAYLAVLFTISLLDADSESKAAIGEALHTAGLDGELPSALSFGHYEAVLSALIKKIDGNEFSIGGWLRGSALAARLRSQKIQHAEPAADLSDLSPPAIQFFRACLRRLMTDLAGSGIIGPIIVPESWVLPGEAFSFPPILPPTPSNAAGDEIRAALSAALTLNSIGKAAPMALTQVKGMRETALAFFPGYLMREWLIDVGNGEQGGLIVLESPQGDYVLVDGTNRPIYGLAAQAIHLTDQNVVDYLRFFFAAVAGPDGSMHIVDGLEDIHFVEPPESSVQDAFREFLHPPRALDKDDQGRQQWQVVLHFCGVLFDTRLSLGENGIINVLEHKPLATAAANTRYVGFLNEIRRWRLSLAGEDSRQSAVQRIPVDKDWKLPDAPPEWPFPAIVKSHSVPAAGDEIERSEQPPASASTPPDAAGDEIRAALSAALTLISLKGAPIALQQVIGMRETALAFFPGCLLREWLIDLGDGEQGDLVVIESPQGECRLMDGTNRPIYDLAKQAIRLTDQNVLDYLRFFFTVVAGPYGAMHIVDALEDIDFVDPPEAAVLEAFTKFLHPPRALDKDDRGRQQWQVIFHFRGMLFDTKLSLSDDGIINIVDHQPLSDAAAVTRYVGLSNGILRWRLSSAEPAMADGERPAAQQVQVDSGWSLPATPLEWPFPAIIKSTPVLAADDDVRKSLGRALSAHASALSEPVTADQVRGLREAPLTFFPDHMLREWLVERADGSLRGLVVIEHPERSCVALTGPNAPIYWLAEKELHLTDDTAFEYVRFFFAATRGMLGEFDLVQSVDEIWFAEPPDEAVFQALANAIRPAAALPRDEKNRRRWHIFVMFKGNLYETDVALSDKGELELENEQRFEIEAVVRAATYTNGLRHLIRIHHKVATVTDDSAIDLSAIATWLPHSEAVEWPVPPIFSSQSADEPIDELREALAGALDSFRALGGAVIEPGQVLAERSSELSFAPHLKLREWLIRIDENVYGTLLVNDVRLRGGKSLPVIGTMQHWIALRPFLLLNDAGISDYIRFVLETTLSDDGRLFRPITSTSDVILSSIADDDARDRIAEAIRAHGATQKLNGIWYGRIYGLLGKEVLEAQFEARPDGQLQFQLSGTKPIKVDVPEVTFRDGLRVVLR